MQHESYEAHLRAFISNGRPVDPLIIMANWRRMMLSAAARKYNYKGFRRDYMAMRERVMARAYLPDRTPRNALDAGLMVLERAQVMGARA